MERLRSQDTEAASPMQIPVVEESSPQTKECPWNEIPPDKIRLFGEHTLEIPSN
jgi:hypothetical protein